METNIKSNNYEILSYKKTWIENIRERFISVLENSNINSDMKGIFRGILLGDKSGIPDDLKQSLVKILYHKVNSEITKQEELLDQKKSNMKGFSKFLRLDKLKRILEDEN